MQSPRQQFLTMIKDIMARNPARASETKPVHAPATPRCSGNFKPRRETTEQRRQRKLQAERNRLAKMPVPEIQKPHFKAPTAEEIALAEIEQTVRYRDRKGSGRYRRSA